MKFGRRSAGAALLASMLLVACGGDGGSSTDQTVDVEPGGSTSTSAAAAPEGATDPDATIRYAYTAALSTFDPTQVSNENSIFPYYGPMVDGLLGLDPNGQILNRLATGYELSDDGLSYTFTLREGATFHDGTPIDADAVVANMERNLGSESAVMARLLTGVESVEAPDATTVVFDLSAPNPILPARLGHPILGIFSPDSLDELATAPVGSGPYQLVSIAASEVTYERFDGYWDEENPAPAANLAVVQIQEESAFANALRAGEVEVGGLQPSGVREIEQLVDEGFQLVVQPTPSVLTLYLNISRPPLDQVEVRQAIAHAIDRETLATSLFGDLCPATSQPFGAGLGHLDELDDFYEYDLDETARLLGEAGVDGLTLTGVYPQTSSPAAVAPALQSMLAQAGIDLQATATLPPEARPAFREGGVDSLIQLIVGDADPSVVLQNNFLGGDSPGGLPDDVQALAEAFVALPLEDPDRAATLEEFNQAVVDQAIHIPLCRSDMAFLAQTNVVGIEEMPFSGILSTIDPRTLGLVAG